MTTLITGGTGFIGSRLALRIQAEGGSVRVLGQSRNPVEAQTIQELEARGAEVAVASVTDRAALGRAVAGCDVVFHLAAAQHEANVPDQHFRDVNVQGTRNVLDASREAGVGRLVHASSIGVYGWEPGQTVSEDSPTEPDNIYGVTKLAGEAQVRSLEGGLDWTILRIAETYGPGDHRLLKLFRGVRRGVFRMIGRGDNLHHLVYIDDLMSGLLLASTQEAALGQTLVLAGESAITTREMVAAIADALGTRPPRLGVPLAPVWWTATVLETALRPLGIQPPLHRRRMDFFRKSFRFSGEDARKRLGYTPRIDPQAGMQATARWYQEQGLL